MNNAPTPPKTVRVRIVVAVYSNGEWASFGHSAGAPRDHKEWIAIDDLAEVIRYCWIEADVTLPTEETISGNVSVQDAE